MDRVGHERSQAKKADDTRDAMATLAASLAEPRTLRVVLPALVAVLGLALVAIADVNLRESGRTLAAERLGERNRLVIDAVSHALGQADELIDRVAELAASRSSPAPSAGVGRTLVDLVGHRAGVAWVSISYPDGRFEGAFLGDDGRWRYQHSELTDDRTLVRRFLLDDLSLAEELRNDYDPRDRDFYRLGMNGRVWTAPYTFYGNHHTGITRAAPVMVGGALHAVVTVDFDVDALSAFLGERPLVGTRTFLLGGDVVLGSSENDGPAFARAAAEHRAVTTADVHDAVLDALMASRPAPLASLTELDVGGQPFVASSASFAPAMDLDWRTVTIAPASLFATSVRRYELVGAAVSLVAVAIATALAFLLARHFLRVKREVIQAKEDARAAEERANLLGSYRLVSLLGKGAMGEVWRARHELLARDAAVKLVSPSRDGVISEMARTRFRREAEALAKLESRHTIEIFDFGISSDGRFFLVMELLDGLDLDTLVEKHGPLPASRVVSILRQVCRSLAEAHDAGLVHRDIKPANIYLARAADEVDVVKVLDFGVVRMARAEDVPPEPQGAEPDDASPNRRRVRAAYMSDSSGVTGTPAFMAPEQCEGGDIDGRADLYALAGVAVYLLTGAPLFSQREPMQLLLAHLTEAVPDLSARMPEVPAPLIALLTRCLAKSPADRPASAREVIAILDAIECARWTETDAVTWWTDRAGKGAEGSVTREVA